MLFRRILDQGNEAGLVLTTPNAAGLTISLGSASPLFAGLSASPMARSRTPSAVRVIRVAGLELSTHDEALGVLEKVAGAVSFELSLRAGIAFTIAADHRSGNTVRRLRAARSSMEFPRSEYDKEPVAMYIHATAAEDMPLLQFLAYYQVLEYYFPVYGLEETLSRIGQILRDPTFSPFELRELRRVVEAVYGRRGLRPTEERAQLLATLRSCVDPDELRRFIGDRPDLENHLAAKAGEITRKQVKSTLGDNELVGAVAERIYDVRNKVVHTKDQYGDDEQNALLPFSAEAELVRFEIQLAEYLAQRVLIASSRAIGLPTRRR